MRNRRGFIWLFFCALTVPLLLLMNVWQTIRYEKYQEKLQALEKEQEEWVEINKKIISAIAVYSSPGRIARVAEESLNLEKADPEDIILIDFGNREGNE